MSVILPKKDMQTPPSLIFDPFLWMMGYSMKKIIKKFSDFYFSSYREKFIENWGTKMIITRKIKIGNLVFLFIQPIPDLSCKFEKLKKKL